MATPKNSEQLDHIQVCIRVRPYNQREKELKANSCLIIEDKDIYLGKQDDEKKFSFDYIADQSVTQEQIYQEIGKPLSEAFQDGYNACVFAYGQTGAGKTHTIFGERTGTMHVNGLQTLVLKDIFEQLPKKIENASILASCCYFEIYNEKFIDLFSKDDKTTLTIKEDLKRGVYVEGLKHQYLNNYTEVMDLYKKGNQRRHVAETKMNLESSRSHCVFQFQIEIKNNDNGVTHTQSAKINFVDLAGSERQKQTEATGQRFEESKNINKSLTMLGRVINALGEKSKLKNNETYHIPFRDSKLTHILKDSLGGNTKCIMVANITQADISYAETLNTLKFAQRTKMISTRAQRNVETQGNVKMLQKEIKFLKQQIYEQEKAMKQMENAYTSENNKLQEQLNTQGDQNDQENQDENEEQIEDDSQQPTQQDMLDLIEEINRLKTELEQKEYQLNLEQLKQTQLQEDLNYQQELNKLQEKQLDEKDQNIKDLTEQMSEAQELFDEMQSEHIKLQSEFEKLKSQQYDQQLKLEQKQKNEENLKSQLEDAEKQNQEIQEKQRQIEKQEQENEEQEKSKQEEKDQKENGETNQLKITLNNQDIPSISENKSVFLDKKQNLKKLLTMRQKTGNQSVLEKTNTRVSFFDKNLSSNNHEAKIEKLEKENQFLHEKLKKYKQLQTKLLSNESFVKGNDSYSFYQQQTKQQISSNSLIPNKFQVFKNSGNTNQSVFIAPIKSKKESQIQNRNQSQLKSFTRNFSMVDAYNASSFINFSQKQQLQKQQQNFSKMQTLGNSLNQSQKINESLDDNQLIENPQMETYKQSGIHNNSESLKKSQQIEQDNLQQSQQYEQQQQNNNKKEEDEGHIPVNVEILEEQQRIKNQEEDALLNLMTENDNLKNLQEEMQEEISELKEDIIKLQDENDTLKETVLFISNQLNENRQSNLQMVSQLDNQGQKLLNSRSKTFSEKLNDKNQEEEQNNNLQQKLNDEKDSQQQENYNQLETIVEEEINQSTAKKNQSQISNTNTNISSFIGEGNENHSIQNQRPRIGSVQSQLHANIYFQYYSRTKFQILIDNYIKMQQFIAGHQKSFHKDFTVYVFLPYQEGNNILKLLKQFFQKICQSQFLLINLMGNELADQHIDKYLIKSIQQFQNLKKLDLNLNHNKITDKSLESLQNLIQNMHNLEEISLNLNQNEKITNDGVKQFLENISKSKTIQEISFSSNFGGLNIQQQTELFKNADYNINNVNSFTITRNKAKLIDNSKQPKTLVFTESPVRKNKGKLNSKLTNESLMRQNSKINQEFEEEQPENLNDQASCKMCQIF